MEKAVVGIVGAGNMGAGIAQKYASEGFSVIVLDTTPQALELGRGRIESTLTEGIVRKVFSHSHAEGIRSRLSYSNSVHDLADADLVIEAIYENKAAKLSLFRELDAICEQKTIFATNTSSFFVSELAQATSRADRVLGLHYFYHPAKNRLVEVIKGKNTSAESFNWAWQLQENLGKIPIESSDSPGFIVNRYFVPWLNEAMRMVEEGLANIATVEAAAQQTFGCGMGPFELMNVTGVPITFHAANGLAEQLGTFYRPAAIITPIIERKVTWDLRGAVDTQLLPKIADRLLGVVFYVATQLSCQENVCSISDCDLGARIGLRWQRGPFELMNQHGLSQTLKLVKALVETNPELSLPACLQGSVNRPFAVELISCQIQAGIGILTFNRPDSLNALNEAMVAELEDKFTALEHNPEVSAIVLTGRGKAFVAGADIKFFVDQIKRGDIDRIVSFSSRGQKLFLAIDQCKKSVVCALNGLALGGGLELALACDYIVCSQSAKLSFPETSIGIYPGLGGTQRLPRRCGVEVAKWLILTGEMIDASTAWRLGLVDMLSSSSDLISQALGVARSGLEKSARSCTPEIEKIKSWFSRGLPIDSKLSNDAALEKYQQKLLRNAPLALAAVERLISLNVEDDLVAGLAQETAGLQAIFSSQDALMGLSSIGRERPIFRGL